MPAAFDARKGVGQAGFMYASDGDTPLDGGDCAVSECGPAQPEFFRGCVVIPSYNSGALLVPTVESVLRHAPPGSVVLVVIDGSTDGSGRGACDLAAKNPALRVFCSSRNEGKGAATLRALEVAHEMGCSHAAVFDSDGQHAAEDLSAFFDAARCQPDAMILGLPVFGSDAPWVRVWGRKLGNWCTHVETEWAGIGDSLFGFRVYPVGRALEVLRVMRAKRAGLGFDFDTQLVVRLYWAGVKPVNLPTRVKYPPRSQGGVSHFRYLRDNALLAVAHAGLLRGAVLRWLRRVFAPSAPGVGAEQAPGVTSPGRRSPVRRPRA